MSWRKLAKSEEFKDTFKPYKTDNKTELPNRAEFTGDKKPKSGDPAKVELNAWHSSNSLGKKDRKEEQKSNGSAILNPKVKRENFNSQKTSNWRNKLLKKAEVAFKQKPDGEVNISVTTPDKSNEVVQGVSLMPSSEENEEEIEHLQTSSKRLNWQKPSRAAYPEAMKVAKEIRDFLNGGFIDPMTSAYRVSVGNGQTSEQAKQKAQQIQEKLNQAGFSNVIVRNGGNGPAGQGTRIFVMVPYNIKTSSKLNWREKLATAEPDVNFKRGEL
ncbi:MAG: hypothetical protein WC346_06345 [Methanogenium sp.]|jgi:hypothetical protein